MKNKNKAIFLVFGLIILLILKLIFFDRDILNIVLSVAYLGFFLITCINYFRKKESTVEKKYLVVLSFLLFLGNVVQTIILLFSGKNILISLYYVVVLWMMYKSLRNILEKKDFNAKKVLVASIVLSVIPSIHSFNLEVLTNVVTYFFIILFFNNSKENYFGLFDSSLIDSSKKKFKFTQWIKTSLIILTGIIYLIFPVVGCIFTVILWFFCFGGFLDKIILGYEQKLFDKRLRKNKVFIASKDVYSLAPSENDFLKKQLDAVAMKTFLEEGIPYEIYALMEVNGSRKYERDYELVFGNADDLKVELRKLFKEKVRPEVIGKILVKMYENTDKISATQKKKITAKVVKITDKFNKEYLKCIEVDDAIENKVDKVNELYKEYCDAIFSSIIN